MYFLSAQPTLHLMLNSKRDWIYVTCRALYKGLFWKCRKFIWKIHEEPPTSLHKVIIDWYHVFKQSRKLWFWLPPKEGTENRKLQSNFECSQESNFNYWALLDFMTIESKNTVSYCQSIHLCVFKNIRLHNTFLSVRKTILKDVQA